MFWIVDALCSYGYSNKSITQFTHCRAAKLLGWAVILSRFSHYFGRYSSNVPTGSWNLRPHSIIPITKIMLWLFLTIVVLLFAAVAVVVILVVLLATAKHNI